MTEDKAYYLVLTSDATEEQARAAFIKRYNINPEKVEHLYGSGREWWVGPAPKTEQE